MARRHDADAEAGLRKTRRAVLSGRAGIFMLFDLILSEATLTEPNA